MATKYKKVCSCFDRLVNAVKPVVGEVARGVFAKNLISSENLRDAENHFIGEGERASKLLSHVLDKIRESENHFDAFVSVLHGIPNLEDLADELTRTGAFKSTGESILRFAMYLKGVYKSAVVSSDKFPHLTCSKFINLALVKKERISPPVADEFTKATLHGHIDEILKKKEPITLEDVLNPTESHSCTKCIFLEGAPGIGKSTCVGELCRRWDEINALKMYSLVILARLREKRVQEAQSVEDLLHHRNKELRRAVAAEIKACEGKGVLFILDGFDELPVSLGRESVFVELIQGTYLSHCTAPVTSRPSATADLKKVAQPQIHKQIEVIGFTQESIENYARMIFGSQPTVLENFLLYISTNPVIKTMMYIPLNSALLVEIYRSSGTVNRPIPHTMTQLYLEMSLILIKRHLREDDPLAKQLSQISRLKDLPSQLYKPFSSLAKLAFEGLEHNKIIFHNLSTDLVHFGFLNSPTELYMGEKVSMSCSFLHLTLQEFLAAFHISQLSPSDQKNVFENHCDPNALSWDVVWRFVAGLTGFSGIGWELVQSKRGRNKFGEVLAFIIRCLCESQEKVECDSVLADSETNLFLLCYYNTAFDCYAAGYCIANSKCRWRLNIRGKSIGGELIEMLKYGLLSNKCLPCRQEVDNIISLNLSRCDLNAKAFDQLAVIIPLMISLSELDISDNPAGEGGLVKLFYALSQLIHLETLDMRETKLGHADVIAMSQLLSPPSSLHKLKLGDKDTSSECMELIVKSVLSPSSLECVHLEYISWTDQAATLLEENSKLTKLSQSFFLNPNFEDIKSLKKITKGLHKNSCLKTLKLNCLLQRDVPVGYTHVEIPDDVIHSLSEMIKCNQSMKTLEVNVSLRTISSSQALTLQNALKCNHTLKQLIVNVPLSQYECIQHHEQLDPRFTLNLL